jgi:hypothetical protein
MLLYLILFSSGGAILALELLASRILTPYFGVSLYIWTGILSITLVALAAGYWWGGRLAAVRGPEPARAARLVRLYALMPALAAFAIVASCLVYPYLFPRLALEAAERSAEAVVDAVAGRQVRGARPVEDETVGFGEDLWSSVRCCDLPGACRGSPRSARR